jgi:protein involved in polysaccharide export with SLBB domain
MPSCRWPTPARSTFFLTAALLIAVQLGCQSLPPARTPEQMALEQPAGQEVVLGPGDEIEVKFFYAPELNEKQTIRPDGKISLQLVGEIEAEGKTPSGLSSELSRLYATQLKKPEVVVIVRSQLDRRVYVGGEVGRPGLIQLPGRMTALEAVMQAGGFDPKTAEIKNVILIRHKDGKRYGCALDFSGTLAGQESISMYLEPHDIIYVPRTTIAEVNQWIDQHVNKLIPRTGLTWVYPVAGGTIGLDTSTAVAVP